MKKSHKLSLILTAIFFAILINTNFACAGAYSYEYISFYGVSPSQPGAVPVYRYGNPRTGQHLYVASEAERRAMENSDYKYEYISFYVTMSSKPGAVPVYRYGNQKTGDHMYVASDAERKALENSDYKYEYISFFATMSSQPDAVPIYRFHNSENHDYIFVAAEVEKNAITLGPEIQVGLWGYSKSDIQSSPFEIHANKAYNIKNKAGVTISQIQSGTSTKVTYDDNGNLKVFGSIPDTLINSAVDFDAVDGDNTSIIFDINRPNSSYDQYRGKIRVQYYRGSDIVGGDTGSTITQIWIINTLPLEQYVWGEGETTGTGPMEHTKVMTTIFRTYGYWYIQNATKYAPYGFKIRSDSGSQIYYGYDWEKDHPNIHEAASSTEGQLVQYNNVVSLTPYSSWSDGRTRSFQERWGSTAYPWCQSVPDPYGKHPTLSTSALEDAGNHMVGLIANGSLNLANNQKWSYQQILKYYFSGIEIKHY